MPAVTRIGDADITHCSVPHRNQGSPTVFCNNIPISRQGDNNDTHLVPGASCGSHVAPISAGSSSVFINGKGCGRIGDSVTSCTSVAQGSPDTFAGG
jgi:uncharacterized Zn-binding protein involved in type VI secretion